MQTLRLANLGEELLDDEVGRRLFGQREEFIVGKQILCRARLEMYVLAEEARTEFLFVEAVCGLFCS